MELRLSLVFGVLLVVFGLAVSAEESNDNIPLSTYNLTYLYTTIEGLYFKRGNENVTLTTENSYNSGFDYHLAKKLAFFNTNSSTIASVPLETPGSTPTIVICVDTSGGPGRIVVPGKKYTGVTAFAVDWLNDRIYYATIHGPSAPESLNSTVHSADLQGGDVRVLYTPVSTVVTGIAVDPIAGYLFWINDRKNIASYNLKSGEHKILLTTENYVNNLAVDFMFKHLYYIEQDLGKKVYTLNRLNYDGSSVEHELYTWAGEVEGNEKFIRWIHFIHGRLLAFVSTMVGKTVDTKSFGMELIWNGHLEVEKVVFSEEEGQSEKPILNARLVHPNLQPKTAPNA